MSDLDAFERFVNLALTSEDGRPLVLEGFQNVWYAGIYEAPQLHRRAYKRPTQMT